MRLKKYRDQSSVEVEEYEPAYEKKLPSKKTPTTIINEFPVELSVFDDNYNEIEPLLENGHSGLRKSRKNDQRSSTCN